MLPNELYTDGDAGVELLFSENKTRAYVLRAIENHLKMRCQSLYDFQYEELGCCFARSFLTELFFTSSTAMKFPGIVKCLILFRSIKHHSTVVSAVVLALHFSLC